MVLRQIHKLLKVTNNCAIFLLQKPSWFPLLNSKYHGLRPELRVVLSLEDDKVKFSPTALEGKLKII